MIPKVILTGNPGGTVIVIRSKNLIIISSADTTSCNLMINMQYDEIAKQKRNTKNLED